MISDGRIARMDIRKMHTVWL